VLEGEVIITMNNGDRTLEVATKRPGDIFGEMAAFDGNERSASASVASAYWGATLLRISGDALMQLSFRYPQIQIRLLRILAENLMRNNALAEFKALDEPSNSALARLASRFKRKQSSCDGKAIQWKLSSKKASEAMERIAPYDIIRSLFAETCVIPTKMTINGKSFYDEAIDRERYKTQAEFFFSLLRQLQQAGMKIASEDGKLRVEVEEFLRVSREDTKALERYEEHQPVWVEVLKLGSFNCFSHADLALRDKLPDLFKRPWGFSKRQGVDIHIRVEEDGSIAVTHCVTYYVTKGAHEGRETLAQIRISWTIIRRTNGQLEAAVYLDRLELVPGVSDEDAHYIAEAFRRAQLAIVQRQPSVEAAAAPEAANQDNVGAQTAVQDVLLRPVAETTAALAAAVFTTALATPRSRF
jgi:hypothetical protein